MIYLITGTPGGGKSLRAVWYAEQFLREGRAVFGNINGYSRQSPIPGMSSLVKDTKSGRWSGGVGGDWRSTPDGSVVIYDEAQRDFPQRSNASAVPDIIRSMETHRHTGHDLLIVTQHPNQVDHWLRRLVGKHDHVRRLGGMNRVALLSADSVMELPVGLESAAGEKQFWKYPKHLYEAYESATFHMVKHRLPQPVIFMLALVGVAILGGLWAYFHFSGSTLDSSQSVSSFVNKSAVSTVVSPVEPDLNAHRLLTLQPVEVRPILPLDEYIQQVKSSKSLMGCARSALSCKCWDISGDALLISDRICFALMESSLSFNLRGYVKKGT
jgi:zona occludens toxin (predicted ATPase)